VGLHKRPISQILSTCTLTSNN